MRSSRFIRRGLLVGALGCATLGASSAAAATASASSGRKLLHGSTPGWLSKASDLGATPAANQVNFGVLLSMRDQAGAEAALQAISDPTSASYGQWLSNAAFDAKYAPSSADVAAVQGWLRSQGFQVTKTLPSGMYVEASGSVAQVEQTFGTQLSNYSYQGKTVRANGSALSLPSNTPASVSGAIAGVIGVDQGSALKQPADTEPGPPPGRGTGSSRARSITGRSSPITSHPPTAGCSRTPSAAMCRSSTSRLTVRADCWLPG